MNARRPPFEDELNAHRRDAEKRLARHRWLCQFHGAEAGRLRLRWPERAFEAIPELKERWNFHDSRSWKSVDVLNRHPARHQFRHIRTHHTIHL